MLDGMHEVQRSLRSDEPIVACGSETLANDRIGAWRPLRDDAGFEFLLGPLPNAEALEIPSIDEGAQSDAAFLTGQILAVNGGFRGSYFSKPQ